MKITTNSQEETIRCGELLGRRLCRGDVVALCGELGSGKTTFTKGVAAGLGIKREKVNSPTFVLIRQVSGGRLPLYHFDLYRLDKLSEIQGLGYEEYFYGDGVTVIEWADKAKSILPMEYLCVKFSSKDEGKRIIEFCPKGERFKMVVREFRKGNF
ncbi:MAG: tRNA (adenosine(37)-N6)-threonylcarbamoyltransferase complex ATPase subunit type 1 TsaE [Candidatus Omnitrophica bacterium]|nr:tRNA (adenosine(37)-N6)-threonylcarbamoyltransferase complex ATPase subunit type 1 TsaE [Candidatus Omnitrophota bacterium]